MITVDHIKPSAEKSFDGVVKRLLKPPMKQLANTVRNELRLHAKSHGWRRFQTTVKSAQLSETAASVYVSDEKNAKKIGGYLEFGTPAHPITAKNTKALHWTVKGINIRGGKLKSKIGHFFAKSVKHPGTKAQPWWKVTNLINEKINKLYSEFIKKSLA